MAVLLSVHKLFLDNGDDVPSEERAQKIVQRLIDIFEGDDNLGFYAVTDLELVDVNGDKFVVGEEDDNKDDK